MHRVADECSDVSVGLLLPCSGLLLCGKAGWKHANVYVKQNQSLCSGGSTFTLNVKTLVCYRASKPNRGPASGQNPPWKPENLKLRHTFMSSKRFVFKPYGFGDNWRKRSELLRIVFMLTYLFTYLLTPWCRALLEKLTGLQLVKKFPAFHGTRLFITALTSFRHLSLSWASPIQSIYPHPTSWKSNTFPNQLS